MQVQMLPLHEAPSPDGHPKTDNQASAALFTQHPLCPTHKASRFCHSFLLALLLICPLSFRYGIAREHYLCNVLTYNLPMTAANSLKTLKIQQDPQSLASDGCYSLKVTLELTLLAHPLTESRLAQFTTFLQSG